LPTNPAVLRSFPFAVALAFAWRHYNSFDWGKFRQTFALIDHGWQVSRQLGEESGL
jgi:hypothetical protein